ncbi:MAG: HIT family protein [Candidatus Heimdallarchaeota archaeon]|nr:HIT family protein [Candidatus Heimdallarchaeota archaeon]MCK4770902.1 HIT family protein [Candidatus Heimdallarchaeota archaeon]
MSDDCIFCKIVKGEIPSFTLYEDEEIQVFLDLYPASKGHSLYIPKEHFTSIYDISEEKMAFLKMLPKIAETLKNATNATGMNILQSNGKDAGQVINHIHFHLIPRYPEDHLMEIVPKSELEVDDARNLVEIFKK